MINANGNDNTNGNHNGNGNSHGNGPGNNGGNAPKPGNNSIPPFVPLDRFLAWALEAGRIRARHDQLSNAESTVETESEKATLATRLTLLERDVGAALLFNVDILVGHATGGGDAATE